MVGPQHPAEAAAAFEGWTPTVTSDAAHPMLPYAGQGANQAIEGAP